VYIPGLPDGFYSDKKSQFGYILGGPWNGKFSNTYNHLEHSTTVGYILWALCSNFVVIFPRFGTLCQTNLATLVHTAAPFEMCCKKRRRGIN
jgi:hypothetical protein